jgi:hypothetical protein
MIAGESVVNSLRQDHHVSGFEGHTNPTVQLVSEIEVTRAFDAIANLFIEVNVFTVKVKYLLLVPRQLLWTNVAYVGVGVASLRSNFG